MITKTRKGFARKKAWSQKILIGNVFPVDEKPFSATTSFEPIRVQSPVVRDERVILPDLTYILNSEEDLIDENRNQAGAGPCRSRSFHQETFAMRKDRALPPSISVPQEGWRHEGRPPLPHKEPITDLVAAKRELKKIEIESKETLERERAVFQLLLDETISRHRQEVNDSEAKPDRVLELTRYDSGTIRAVPLEPNHAVGCEDPESRKMRRELIERHKTEIIALNDEFAKKIEIIKMEYERRMKPWQDIIFRLMGNDENSVTLYSGPLTPDSRFSGSPFSKSFVHRRPSDGAVTSTRRFPRLKIIEK